MRGLAIIFIITNNFTHLLKGVFTDNEYQYHWQYVEGFMNNLSHPDGILPFNLLSFYCPYGVMLFIFLSGYGLVLKYEKGKEISGLERFDGREDVFCFHAGTKFDESGRIVTNGGRVLGVTAIGSDLKAARKRAYEATSWVHFEGQMMRSDIGRAIDEAG